MKNVVLILHGYPRLHTEGLLFNYFNKPSGTLGPSQQTGEVDNLKIKDVLPAGRKKLLEDKIVSLVLRDPGNLNLIEESHHCFFCDKTKNLIENMKKNSNDPTAVLASISKEELDGLSLMAEVDYQDDGPDEIQLCLSQLKDIELRNKLVDLSKSVKLESDEQKREELIKEFSQKAKELHQV